MNRTLVQLLIIGIVLTMVSFFWGGKYWLNANTNNAIEGYISAKDTLSQKVESIALNRDYYFAGERLPIEIFDVRERLDRELMVNSYWHSSTLQLLKLSRRYFYVIEPILKENGIPEDFKYLAVAESGLRQVSSPAGAKGVWQFLKGTAQDYGLEVNSEVDERMHLVKSTRAACQYLKDKYQKFGNWALVAASYNAGERRTTEALNKQRAEDYFQLNMSQETNRYLFRIVAIKEILLDPERFGFQLGAGDYYPIIDGYQEVLITSSIDNWGDFARSHYTHYRMLKVLNPWLIDSKLTVSGKKDYYVKVPY